MVWPSLGVSNEVARYAAERRAGLLEVPHHRVTEDVVPVASLVAVDGAVMRAGCGEADEALRLGHWDGLAEHLVEQRVDGGPRTDAERQREDSDGGHKEVRRASLSLCIDLPPRVSCVDRPCGWIAR